jgi:hypothetical protein
MIMITFSAPVPNDSSCYFRIDLPQEVTDNTLYLDEEKDADEFLKLKELFNCSCEEYLRYVITEDEIESCSDRYRALMEILIPHLAFVYMGGTFIHSKFKRG